ncbi:MAG: efflux RND transporter periplasmic adaptor subunit [Bacteroidaceae bacterium]|nr:efflux RND transporter periplasmic adaptor subunit [Bacteroidaceae bacterium]
MKILAKTILVAASAVAFCSCGGEHVKGDEVKCVNVVVARDANELPPLSYTGRTKAAEEVNVAFRVSGPILRVLVKEGDYVRQGQVVAEMDPRDYQVQLTATQAEYAQVKADAERVIALYQEQNTTAQNYDRARYGLEQITQKLNNHKNQLADTKLRAPISGYVKTKLHEGGETIGAGMPVLIMSSAGDVEVEINLPSVEYVQMDKYTGFYCTFNITGDTRYPLQVVRTSQEANANQLYTVRLKIKGNYDHKKLTPGMTTMVYAQVAEEPSGNIIVPASAIIGDEDKTTVFVYNTEDGTVKSRSVKVEFINPDGTVTVTEGLKVGERIVSTGAHHVVDGQKVEVLKPQAKSNVGNMM